MLGITPTLAPSPGTYLGRMRAALTGDVVFGNLEGTLTDATASKCGGAPSSSCFAFRVPPEYARPLRQSGFTVLSNANNHSFDFGQAGEDDTVRALHRAGIAQTGLPGEITIVRAKDLRIAFLGFAPYPNTGSLTDLRAARKLIHRADRRADLVVCAIHAGAEGTAALHLTGGEETYLGEDRGNPEAFAHMAVDAGADLVLGSGPHVLRAMELYHGRLIAYSLGNFAGYHNFTSTASSGSRSSCASRSPPTGASERAGSCRSGSKAPASRCPIRRARRRRSWPSSRARTSARAGSGWAPAARCTRRG